MCLVAKERQHEPRIISTRMSEFAELTAHMSFVRVVSFGFNNGELVEKLCHLLRRELQILEWVDPVQHRCPPTVQQSVRPDASPHSR